MSYTIKFMLEDYRKSYRSGNMTKEEYHSCTEEILLDEYQAGRITADTFFRMFGRYCVD